MANGMPLVALGVSRERVLEEARDVLRSIGYYTDDQSEQYTLLIDVMLEGGVVLLHVAFSRPARFYGAWDTPAVPVTGWSVCQTTRNTKPRSIEHKTILLVHCFADRYETANRKAD